MGQKAMKDFLVIFERAKSNRAAYAPDVPGCIATGQTRDECEANFRDALAFHFEGLRNRGEPIPEPTSEAGQVSVVV
jgi:predicted RNase H-like HicB family nuclease